LEGGGPQSKAILSSFNGIVITDMDSSRSLVNGSQFYLARLIAPRSPSTCG
jgi:hypothetical protein